MLKSVGYSFLIEKYGVQKYLRNYQQTWIAPRPLVRESGLYHHIQRHFTSQYDPGQSLGGQLEFAIKYEGLNPHLLFELFKKIPRSEILDYISSKQTGKYARKIWYLYEKLTESVLTEIPDLQKIGNYVPLLDPDEYVCGAGSKSPRHRIEDNLLGSTHLSPMIRKTEKIKKYLQIDHSEKVNQLTSQYSHELLMRATHYLYTKETKSSFEIEKEVPDSKKSERFIQILKNVGGKDYLIKSNLITLQNAIVDPRFADVDYRTSQNYIGETLPNLRQKLHYICPQPQDVPWMMDELRALFDRGVDQKIHPFILAVVVSFAFVYIHPFEDGNGRIHRFLLHDILNKTHFTPEGLMFPISATLLRNKSKYDYLLESFSQELVELLDYELDEEGRMSINGQNANFYRFIDMTVIAEGMFELLNETIEKDLKEELEYLSKFDINMKDLKEIVDMPNKDLNLFIRLCLANGGKLSATKRKSHFDYLSDNEVAALEAALLRDVIR